MIWRIAQLLWKHDIVRPFSPSLSLSCPVPSNPWLQVYYLLYDNDGEAPSKVSVDPEQPSLGRIRADSVAPCHRPAAIKRRIARVEEKPALAVANLLADVSCDTPMKEVYMPILNGDVPGLSQYKPMVLVQDIAYT